MYRFRRVGLLMGMASVAACAPGPQQDPNSKCFVEDVAHWREREFNEDITNPRCPIGIPEGSFQSNMVAGVIEGWDWATANWLELTIFDLSGDQIGFFTNPFSDIGGLRREAEFTVGYLAGFDGPAQAGQLQADLALASVPYLGTPSQAAVWLEYTYFVGVAVNAPYNPDTNTWYTIGGTFTNYKAPLTYQWFINGVAISGGNGSTFQFSAGTSGTYEFRVDVVDADGDTGSNAASAYFGSSGGGGGGSGGGEIPCSGLRVQVEVEVDDTTITVPHFPHIDQVPCE